MKCGICQHLPSVIPHDISRTSFPHTIYHQSLLACTTRQTRAQILYKSGFVVLTDKFCFSAKVTECARAAHPTLSSHTSNAPQMFATSESCNVKTCDMRDELPCGGMSTRCNVEVCQHVAMSRHARRVAAVSTCVQCVCMHAKLQCHVMGARVQAISRYKPISRYNGCTRAGYQALQACRLVACMRG